MMKTFHIEKPDEALSPIIQAKIDNLNKPKGSLGRLESLALQVCLIQQTLSPTLSHPCHLLLGGDHGIEREGSKRFSTRGHLAADDKFHSWRWRS